MAGAMNFPRPKDSRASQRPRRSRRSGFDESPQHPDQEPSAHRPRDRSYPVAADQGGMRRAVEAGGQGLVEKTWMREVEHHTMQSRPTENRKTGLRKNASTIARSAPAVKSSRIIIGATTGPMRLTCPCW